MTKKRILNFLDYVINEVERLESLLGNEDCCLSTALHVFFDDLKDEEENNGKKKNVQ